MKNANFICEIGCEEVPAGYMPPAIEALLRLFSQKLVDNRISFEQVRVYATPRRFVIAVAALADAQNAEEVELKGPAAKSAYAEDGSPSKALQGFLKGNGLSIDAVSVRETDKGSYIYASKKLDSRKTEEIIPSLLTETIEAIPFPKRMRWSDKKVTFPRPIVYFLVLFNDALVPFALDGIKADRYTRGHYVQHTAMIPINAIADYEQTLERHGVILDQDRRKDMISRGLSESAKMINSVLVEDEDLLSIVTYLVENPHVVTCTFDSRYLAIPDIVLITEMKEHQKYFALREQDGKLSPNFLVVSNNPASDFIRAGNVRVVTARFNDARFYFDEDRKQPLAAKVESLKNVLFHKELGTIFDKMQRMEHIADYIADALSCDTAMTAKIKRAVLLSKADLNMNMVFEFTSLQGKIGALYALLDGEDPAVAQAIDDQYKPRFHGDSVSTSMVSIVLSIAEKLDNVFGSFSVGNIPKGSADPYALRRQSSAIVEMLISNGLRLDLRELLNHAAVKYREGSGLVQKILEFIIVRVKTIFTDHNLRYDEIDACLNTDTYDFYELYLRAQSVNDFRKDPSFSAMLLSFKRMNNIVSAFRAKNPAYTLQVNERLINDIHERDLQAFFKSREADIKKYIETNDYRELFKLLITGKPAIDSFFDHVMVMAEDTAIRDNRLAILENILRPFKNLLDFSRISE